MPYQNLNSEIMFAMAIWLLAIFVFAMMIMVVFAKLISENRTKNETTPKDELQTMRQQPSQAKENIPAKE